MSIADNQVKVLLSRCSAVSALQVKDYRQFLSQDELARNARYRFEEDRHRDLLARALVRVSLAELLDKEPSAITLVRDDKDKPQLQFPQGIEPADIRHSKIHFNLSHSGDWVILAIAKTKVGVDVEFTQRKNDVLAIADRYFFGDEIEELFNYPESQREERFFDYWTLKEAYMKARGEGISLGLSNFAFRLNNGIQLHVEPAIDDDPALWQFRCLSPEPDYRLSIATKYNHKPVYCFEEVIPLVNKKRLAWSV